MNTLYLYASPAEQAVYTLAAVLVIIGLAAIAGKVWP